MDNKIDANKVIQALGARIAELEIQNALLKAERGGDNGKDSKR